MPTDLPVALAPVVRRLWSVARAVRPMSTSAWDRAPGGESSSDGTRWQPDDSADLVRACRQFTRGYQGRLCQQSGTTCGPNALAMLRVLTDPDYAATAALDRDAGTWGSVERRLQRVMNAGGGGALPWPTAWGTLPWTLARQLELLTAGPSRWRVVRVDPWQTTDVRSLLVAAGQWCRRGIPVPVYIGNDRLPRHVTLLLGMSDQPGSEEPVVTLYDPSIGDIREVTLPDLVAGRARIAGWRRVWAGVLPHSAD